jgi:signal transduction histidine kinase/DNA-binding NarL/FixJ family response regulator
MERRILVFIVLFVGTFSALGILEWSGIFALPGYSIRIGTFFTLLGWVLFFSVLFLTYRLGKLLYTLSSDLGIDFQGKPLQEVIQEITDTVYRKDQVLSLNLIEQKITSKEELSKTLERIVALGYRLLGAESVELALFDKEAGIYHSSFVLGKPFRTSAQAMLCASLDSTELVSPDVLVQPIAFAGAVRGTLRVGLKKGCLPSVSDNSIMKLLAVQSTIAIINSEYTTELLRMKMLSEESVKAKTGFLANLSHEIRGPLGIMLNSVELILDGLCGSINEDQGETLQMVKQNGAHLLELINDVLDYAKVESGRTVVNKVDISVNDLLLDIVKIIRTQADTKSHDVILMPSEEQLIVSCDKRHARQMLINLLTNAVKYTPDKGRIEVWAERIPGNKIKINVRDTGVGIEQSQWSKVFTPFERVDNAYSLKQVGAGLGMSLTQKLVEVNGGNIAFDSWPKKGSHFWLTFPAVEAEVNMLSDVEREGDPIIGEGKSLLIVAEEDKERGMMERYLLHHKFRVFAATRIDEALDLMRSKHIDLLIVENNTVDTYGEGFIREFREKANAPSLPIILVTSRGFVFDVEKYLRAGVDRCLTRPVQLRELATVSSRLVEDNRAAIGQALVQSEESLRESSISGKNFKNPDLLH